MTNGMGKHHEQETDPKSAKPQAAETSAESGESKEPKEEKGSQGG